MNKLTTDYEFAGFWGIVSRSKKISPAHNTITVEPGSAGLLELAPLNGSHCLSISQALNIYSRAPVADGTYILQSQSNGKYVTFIADPELGQVLAATADKAEDGTPFQLPAGSAGTSKISAYVGDKWQAIYADFESTPVLKAGTDTADAVQEFLVASISAKELLEGGAQFPCQNPLRYADLSGRDLSGKNFAEYDFSGADLSGANLSGSDFSLANLTAATFDGADLSGARLSGANLTNANLTSATSDAQTAVAGTAGSLTKLVAAILPFGLLGRNWQWIDLSYATILDLPDELSSKESPLKAAGSVLTGLKSDLYKSRLDYADFNNADLRGLYLESARMSGASLVGTLLNGANLQFAYLTAADLSGAQLGSIALRFKVTDGTDVESFVKALAGEDVTTVEQLFQENGVTLGGTVTISSSKYAPGRAWVVADQVSTNITTDYNVRLEGTPNEAPYIGVYLPSKPAILGSAYLNGATMTSANLYGVNGAYAQFYGTAEQTTALDSAILENARFPNANMSGTNLQKSRLYGIELAGATLTNAQLNGADLSPSESGTQADLTGANLQSSDFSGAKLDGAIFTNAAVALPKTTQPQKSEGVWLFNSEGTDHAALLDELTAAAEGQFSMGADLQSHLRNGPVEKAIQEAFEEKGITLERRARVSVQADGPTWLITDGKTDYQIDRAIDDKTTGAPALQVEEVSGGDAAFFISDSYEADLANGPADAAVIAAFKAQGVTLSATAEVKALKKPVAWQISGGAANYTLWLAINPGWTWSLYARPSLPALRQWFAGVGLDLRWQTTVSGGDGAWQLSNDASNPWDRQLGYVVFNLVQDPESGPLDVYGHQMRIERYAGDNTLEYHIIVAGPTTLSEQDLAGSTICPNGQSAAENKTNSLPFVEWMLARKPPTPPSCVIPANDGYYCPQPSGGQAEDKTDARAARDAEIRGVIAALWKDRDSHPEGRATQGSGKPASLQSQRKSGS